MDTDALTYELKDILGSREEGADLRVDRVLKDGPRECTERVYIIGAGGGEYGPFIHKRISAAEGLGAVYQTLFDAWSSGRRFVHLPAVYRVVTKDSNVDIVMEDVEGETLDQYLSQARFDQSTALLAFSEVCRACIELHESFDAPIIHRDLKPSNIVIASNRFSNGITAVLIDFGISRQWHEGEGCDTVHFGTREFAPPEQFGFAQTTVKSDVYALGMLLAYCLLGEVPQRESLECKLSNAGAPDRLRSIVFKATEFDPSSRYPSVRELLCDLLAAIEDRDRAVMASSTRSNRSNEDGAGLFIAPRRSLMEADDHMQGRILDAPYIRIPWNAFVVLVAATTLLACLEQWETVQPSSKSGSVAAQAIMLFGIVFPAFLFVYYLLLNKSFLRKRLRFIDFIAKIGIGRVALGFLAYELAMMALAVLLWAI